MAEKLTALAAYLEEFNVLSVTVRILLATLCGGVLGIERGKANQAAGMRTHILVCLGATLIMLTGEYMFHKFSTGDPARLGAQVVSGIDVEFHDPSCLETICNILQSCGVQVGEVTMNNPGNSGNYNAIILLKNLDNKSSSQIEEFLEHVTEIDTLKFLN